MNCLQSNIAETSPDELSTDQVADHFRELHRLTVATHEDYPALYQDYLETGCRLLGMSSGIVSNIVDDTYTVLAIHPKSDAIATGDTFPVNETYCVDVVEQDQVLAYHHVGNVPSMQHHPVYTSQQLEAYIAAPIRVEGKLFGTLNFTHREARRQPFPLEHLELVELMAVSLGRTLETDLMQQQRNHSAQQLRDNTELFESAFRFARIGMALVAPDGRWLRSNDSLCSMLGYSEDELLQLDFQSITHPEDLDTDLELVNEMMEGTRDTYEMEKRYFHKGGDLVWAKLSVSLVRTEDGEPHCFVSQIQDISDQKRMMLQLDRRQADLEVANQRLQQLATIDELTSVYNRRAFEENLQRLLQTCSRARTPLSLLLIDADHFKRINDDFGHPEGDRVLRKIADALSQVARTNDVVARYGGEEFAAILPTTDQQGCEIVSARIHEAIGSIDGLQRPVTVSIGAATVKPSPKAFGTPDIKRIVGAADEALYSAKAAGRNQSRFVAL